MSLLSRRPRLASLWIASSPLRLRIRWVLGLFLQSLHVLAAIAREYFRVDTKIAVVLVLFAVLYAPA